MTGGPDADLNWMVSAFVDNVAAARHAVVVSSDGLPLAVSDEAAGEHMERLAAITAGLSGLTQGLTRVLDGGNVTQTVIGMSEATLVVTPISDGSALVVLAASESDMGLVAYEMTLLAERVGSALTPEKRIAGSH